MFDETIYIIVIKNPFNNLPYVFVNRFGKSNLLDDITSVLKYNKIVSYGFEDLIDIIRKRGLNINPLIFDIVTMKKLCVGKPKNEYNDNLPWDLIPLIGKYVDKTTVVWLKMIINFEIINLREDENYQKNINNLMEGFIKYFHDIEKQLKSEEYNRYYDTEIKLYKIFINTQKKGIRIDQKLLENKIIELRENYYFSIKILEIDYGFNSEFIQSKMQWSDISKYCKLQNFESDFDYNFWSTVELLHEEDEFLKYLLDAHDSFRDYNELLKYKLDKYYLIYPIFDIVGTITSRIQIISPGIQFIKKSNRDIFIPRDNMIFLYADFCQFEPGILASFSGDEKFLVIYNRSDVYEELSKLLFNDVTHRRICKTLFLAFVYGMKKDNIYKLIEKITDNITAEKGIKFFEHFNQIQEWKKSKVNEAKSIGYSKSYFGNYRYLKEKGKCTDQEKRWIPNQIIQGTASYIFKTSILELYKNVKDIGVNLLIPMHDAILLEVPTKEIDKVKNLVTNIFSDYFSKVCPKIIPRISFDEFAR